MDFLSVIREMSNRLFLVDVFAERAYSGNQLAVVICDATLSDESMQRIATEMNFSETTFVMPDAEPDRGFRVRIFTPVREIDFAGHPILGTAWVIRECLSPWDVSRIQLNLAKACVSTRFELVDHDREVVWFRAPPMILGACPPAAEVAASLGLTVDDLDPVTPVQTVSAGTAAVLVPLRSLDALRRSRLDLDRYQELAADGYPPLLYQFVRETFDVENDMCARFFFEANGVREDPATGNGAAFLGAYLLEYAVQSRAQLSLRIEQGQWVNRPSLIHLRMQIKDGQQHVQIGGNVVAILRGELISRLG